MVEESKERDDDIDDDDQPVYAITSNPEAIIEAYSNEIGYSLNMIRTLVSKLKEQIP